MVTTIKNGDSKEIIVKSIKKLRLKKVLMRINILIQ
jgi:hypothetical protein